MLLPRKWALSLGLLATAPGLTVAGPLDFLKGSSDKPEAAAAETTDNENQQVAEEIGKAMQRAHVAYKNVQIEFKGGVATIKGQIKDDYQKAQVTRAVSRVPSVKSVDNQLAIMDPPAAPARPQQTIQQASHAPSDERGVLQAGFDVMNAPNNQQVAQNIAEALTAAGLSGYDIEVRYKNGAASLLGSVEDPEQATRAERAARSVPGVNQIFNKLTVKGKPAAVQPAGGPGQYGGPGPYGGPGRPMAPPPGYPMSQGQMMPPSSAYPSQPPGYPQGYPVQQAQGMVPPSPPMGQGVPPGAGMPPQQYASVQQAGHHLYNQPNMPQYAWPSYAPYDNSAAVTYPSQYDASAWPYIGPYYPYPQVPLGWRKSTLEWDDGNWSLKFDSKTDRWWWFLNPHNWH